MDTATMQPVASRKGTSKTATAAAKGAYGHALAVTFIKDAEKQADMEVKQAQSRKDRLAEVEKMTREDHLEFRAVLKERRQQVADVAAGLGMSLAKYLQGDAKSNSVIVTVSMWLKLSQACEAGFKPDYNLPWAEISVMATDALQAKASNRQADDSEGEEGPATQTAAPTARRGRKAKTNLEKATALLEGMPLQDLESIHAWLGEYIAKAKAPRTGGRAKKGEMLEVPKDFKVPKGTPANDHSERAVAAS